MRLWLASDLHLEHVGDDPSAWASMVQIWTERAASEHPQALVLAGDIHHSELVPTVLRTLWHALQIPIIFVAGNHEFYRRKRSKEELAAPDEVMTKLAIEVSRMEGDVRVLHRDTTFIDSVAIHGCTLWADGLDGTYGMQLADYRRILRRSETGLLRLWTRDAMIEAHNADVSWLEEVLAAHHGQCEQVVVTHHIPSFKAVAPRFRDGPNGEFASDLEWLIHRASPRAWLFGHMHDAFEGFVGETFLACHPAGYPGEHVDRKEDYVPRLVDIQ